MTQVKIPSTMETPPYQAQRTVDLPAGELPLIHPGDPDRSKVRKRLIAHVRVFKLSDPADLKVYEDVWQKVCDGLAQVSESPQPTFSPQENTFCAFLRWSEVVYLPPGQDPA